MKIHHVIGVNDKKINGIEAFRGLRGGHFQKLHQKHANSVTRRLKRSHGHRLGLIPLLEKIPLNGRVIFAAWEAT